MSSPGIITYPLGGITYDAEDAAAYFAGRTSGVYSTDTDFAVAAAADDSTDLTVSAGQAWIHVSRWVGLSVTMREAQTLALPLADSALPRIDRVVLRYDATSRSTSLQVLQGAPSSEPAAPAISHTELVYDLCLCQISRPAGQTALTTANLTDTRTDEALCGLMRDGVTGIPMDELGAQALAKAKETAKLCDKLLASYSGGYLGIWPVSPDGGRLGRMHRRARLRLQADGRTAGGERGKRPLRRTHPGDLHRGRLCGPRGRLRDQERQHHLLGRERP